MNLRTMYGYEHYSPLCAHGELDATLDSLAADRWEILTVFQEMLSGEAKGTVYYRVVARRLRTGPAK